MACGEKREAHSVISGLLALRSFERRSRRLIGAGYFFATAMLALTFHAPPRAATAPEKPDRIMYAPPFGFMKKRRRLKNQTPYSMILIILMP